jgi:hypothetical protein
VRFLPGAGHRGQSNQNLDDLLDGKDRPPSRGGSKPDLDDLLGGDKKFEPKPRKK